MPTTKSAQVRQSLGFPVIDADGHFVEVWPMLHHEILGHLEQEGGAALVDRFRNSGIGPLDTSTVLANREGARGNWSAMPSWWGWQTRNVLDRATMHLPALIAERLDDFGIDFGIMYPSMSLGFLQAEDPELVPLLCRATNNMHARMFTPYTERMTVGGLVPMITPEIAIAELEHAVLNLGMKTVVIAGATKRPIPNIHRDHPEYDSIAYHLDVYGLDSEYDYDPFWRRCVELNISPVSHSSLQAYRATRSVSNYVYNHVGGLGSCHESLCKSLFMGGVTNRFPELRIGFLEGGVGWACGVYADMLGHWSKRNKDEITQLDPDLLDVDMLMSYVDKYGTEDVQARREEIREFFARPAARPQVLDEFEAAGISSKEDFRDKFVPRFYFGCEADDPLVAWAFRTDLNPLGAKLQPIFGSDISHWDVQDMNEPVEESYELVEHGVLTLDQYREFMFVNPATLHATSNRDFFEGTVVESAVDELYR